MPLGGITKTNNKKGAKMANPKFITVKGKSEKASKPYYVGHVQHEHTMTVEETNAYLEEKLGYTATQIRATNLALAKRIKQNAQKAVASLIDGVATVRPKCKGSFDTNTGPWVKGRNYLQVSATEVEPFKSTFDGIVPENKTEGAKPAISSVYDKTTGVYDVLGAGDVVSIAGTDLAPDRSADDEYVALVASNGTETKLEITDSDLITVEVRMPSTIAAGAYTLKVYTRSGFGSEFGVKTATRKVTVE